MKTLLIVITSVILCATHFGARADDDQPLGLSAEQIAAYPSPQVTPLLPNEQYLYDRQYRRVLEATPILEAPDGPQKRVLAQGFNFVTIGTEQAGWAEISAGAWLASTVLEQAQPSRFAGVQLPDTALPYPFGWILVNVVPSRTPGADPTYGDLAILRYTLVNLYAQVDVQGWTWYQVGADQWIDQRLIARYLPVVRDPAIDTEKWISVDLYEQVAIAYEGSRPVFATLIASGLSAWPTNEGLFHIYARHVRTVMSGAEGQEDFYYLEEVPWTMYFDGDIGLHGTYWHDGFGYRHSHGCVNMSITDSSWMYNWSSSEIDLSVPSDTGAAVYVYSSGVYR